MSRYFFLLSISFFLAVQTFAQKPDYKKLENLILEDSKTKAYSLLMNRYKNNDSTLSLDELRTLYYGFIFTNEYKAYGSSKFNDSLRVYYRKDSLTHADCMDMIRLENYVVEEFPFDIRHLNALGYCYSRTGQRKLSEFAYWKADAVVRTINSSGNGLKEKTAWHVIAVGHEYDLLDYYGFQFGGSQSLTKKTCDYLTVEKNKEGIEGFYFDVNQLMKSSLKMFDK